MSTPDIHTLSQRDLQVLADRLFSCGVSHLSTIGPKERADMIAASRVLRALLRHIELKTVRQLQTVLLAGRLATPQVSSKKCMRRLGYSGPVTTCPRGYHR